MNAKNEYERTGEHFNIERKVVYDGKEYERTGRYFKMPSGTSALVYVDKEGKEYVLHQGKMTSIEQIKEEKEEKQEEAKLGTTEKKLGTTESTTEATTTEVAPLEKELGTTREIEIVKKASEYASILRDVIEKQKLYTVIKGKKYVRVEGWQTLGALLKCRAVITKVKETPEFFEATAEIINQSGQVMGRGMARCYFSEKNWQDRDKYAILSMAQTRAIGKAYRNNFSWILSLGGYEPTPAEEVE